MSSNKLCSPFRDHQYNKLSESHKISPIKSINQQNTYTNRIYTNLKDDLINYQKDDKLLNEI